MVKFVLYVAVLPPLLAYCPSLALSTSNGLVTSSSYMVSSHVFMLTVKVLWK